jgi:two-component system, sensor histidine kinase RegB
VESTQGGHGVGLYLAFSSAARLGGSIELTDASQGAQAAGATGEGTADGRGGQGSNGSTGNETPTGVRARKARGTRALLRVPAKRVMTSEPSPAARESAAAAGSEIGSGEGPTRPDAA